MTKCILVAALTLLVACHETPASPIETAARAAPILESCADGVCQRFGVEGDCVRGECILSASCSKDTDCDDGNTCTDERCDEGTCVEANVLGPCTTGLREGQCEGGRCEVAEAVCASDGDCRSENPCAVATCREGTCKRTAQDDGTECTTVAGRVATCTHGICSAGLSASDSAVQNERGVRYVLPTKEVRTIEGALEARIADELRYDMKVVLVPLASGGYNIVLHNRRLRTEVRGLCDPSFVALNIAEYTARTNWKSENLHIWLVPFQEGWAVSTRGSRASVEKGQASSPLGMFGVIDVRAFRTWLERAFTPIEPAHTARRPDEFHLDASPKPTLEVAQQDHALSPATPRKLSGDQEVDLAWKLYGRGQLAQARQALRRAAAAGSTSPELAALLDDM
jgi:hypothetical protein